MKRIILEQLIFTFAAQAFMIMELHLHLAKKNGNPQLLLVEVWTGLENLL
ncbi:MAG: hypothetical protein K9J37_17075 [Saprospiraceae bacterium]|nr:hypothetical protein [Saprospiraceae bacterium]MCF8251630.1 hypothetical protein [Saprospiraceae bacterium]MCF8281351.1 hypothetical protein [Bacteroidales bacterium]MCF8312280.1 hypothetical protein [Saprospiraceae bacterium]MCF8441988.1 hypothetical protein [Saprospiraceae bacterium]